MKQNVVFQLLIALIFCIVYAYAFEPKLDLNGDNANYMHYAENIAKGNGYAGNTPDGLLPASQYPPAYSAFLALFMALGIHNLIFFKILNGILLAGSLLLLFYIVRKITQNNSLSFACCLIPVFSHHLLHFSNIVMSEMLFLFFTVLCFFALYKYMQKKGNEHFLKSPWFYTIILAAAGAYYTRTVGMAVILAVVVFFLFRKEWRQAAASFLGIIFLNIPWAVRNSIHGIQSRYFGTIMTVNPWRPENGTISTFGELIEKMINNFDETVIKGFKEILFPFLSIDYGTPSGFWAVTGGLLILSVVFYGAWHLKGLRWAMTAYLIGQIGLFMLWHGGNGTRYVVPAAPFIFVCFYTGAYYILNFIFKRRVSTKGKYQTLKKEKYIVNAPYLFLIVILAMMPSVKTLAAKSRMPYPPAYQNYFTIAREMEKQLPAGKICCCRKPELFRYYAPGIYAVNYAYSTNPLEVVQNLVDKKVDFVILEQLGYASTPRYLYPAIEQYPDLFPAIWHLEHPDTYLLKFEIEKAQHVINEAAADK